MKKIVNKYFSTIKKFVPDQEERSMVGVDIGANSCKMIELQAKGNAYTIINYAIESISGGDQKKALSSVLSKCFVPTTFPITAVFGKGTLIRYIDMTRMTIDDLKKSFSYEADKYFPFPQDQIYTDCFIIDPKVADNKMSVLVAASKKDLIDTRIKLLTELGLQADFIGLNPIAIANVFNVLGCKGDDSSDDKSPNVTAVLDIGEAVSNLTILMGNVPRFTRDIFIGGFSFTKSISNALGISFEEAEKLKCSPGEKKAEVLAASDSTVMNLVSELRLSFDYFVTEKSTPISKLLLTGGVSTAEGLTDLFSKNLEIPVEKWRPLESLELSKDVSAEDIKRESGKLGVALGLALYQ